LTHATTHHARMTILRERVVWKKDRPASQTRRSSDLTPEEQANVRAAMMYLRVRHGTLRRLARLMRANEGTVMHAMHRTVSAGIALRVARVAETTMEDLIGGAWLPPGVCRHCGRRLGVQAEPR
jgi:hypothetical protein